MAPEVRTRSPFLFNPARASAAELAATFVGREALALRLEEALAADALVATRRHWLLIAPRGSGKSHLTTLVAERLRTRGVDVVRLPEEQYQVGSLAGLYEYIVRGLNDGVSPFANDPDVNRVIERAEAWLRKRLAERRMPAVVILENLGDLLDRKLRSNAEQARLRGLLSNDSPVLVLATSTGWSDAFTRHDAPFYDFFQTELLADLSQAAVHDLVRRRLEWDGPAGGLGWPDLQPRVDTLYHFSGGNPRLVLALYEVLRLGVSGELHGALVKLLDDVTPYFQARLRDLSPQQEQVLVTLALQGGPRPPSDIATAVRLPTAQVTAVVTQLQRAGLVRPAGPKAGRKQRYEVVDRLFRIWLQMRDDTRADARLTFLVEFFEAWYRDHDDEGRAAMDKASARFWGRVADSSGRAEDARMNLGYLSEASDSWLGADFTQLEALLRSLGAGRGPAERAALLAQWPPPTDEEGKAIRAALDVIVTAEAGRPDEAIERLRVGWGAIRARPEPFGAGVLRLIAARFHSFSPFSAWVEEEATSDASQPWLWGLLAWIGCLEHEERLFKTGVPRFDGAARPSRSIFRPLLVAYLSSSVGDARLGLWLEEADGVGRPWPELRAFLGIRDGRVNAEAWAAGYHRAEGDPFLTLELQITVELLDRAAWRSAVSFIGEPVGRSSFQAVAALITLLRMPPDEPVPASWSAFGGDSSLASFWSEALASLVPPPQRLARYARAVQLGMAPPDLPVYSTALRAQSDPTVLDDLPGEERDAVQLLLSAARTVA